MRGRNYSATGTLEWMGTNSVRLVGESLPPSSLHCHFPARDTGA